MERLTKWLSGGAVYADNYTKYGPNIAGLILDRLAAYEDTGLEPEEIADLKDGICMGCSAPAIVAEQRHIQDLLDAENDGRLVVLPCDIGDNLWYIHNGGIYQATVHEISISPSGETALRFGGWPAKAVWGCNIGKTVFLTIQEAEEALRKETENA